MAFKRCIIAVFLMILILLGASSCLRIGVKINMHSSTKDPQDYRPDYDLGGCCNLNGDVLVAVFYMNDFESMWINSEIKEFYEFELRPALDFLEENARKYDVDLKFNVVEPASDRTLYYDGEVINDISAANGYATTDVLEYAAFSLGYMDDGAMIEALKAEYQVDEVICYAAFNKEGFSYGLNPPRGSSSTVDEHCIIFSRDLDAEDEPQRGAQSSMIAQSTLFLYGAEKYKGSPLRVFIGRTLYKYDIMVNAAYNIENNEISGATAYYIGWSDEIPYIAKIH